METLQEIVAAARALSCGERLVLLRLLAANTGREIAELRGAIPPEQIKYWIEEDEADMRRFLR